MGSTPGPDITCGLSLVVLVLVLGVFLRVLRFSSLHINQNSKYQFDLETVVKMSHLLECPLLNSILHLLLTIIIIIIVIIIIILKKTTVNYSFIARLLENLTEEVTMFKFKRTA